MNVSCWIGCPNNNGHPICFYLMEENRKREIEVYDLCAAFGGFVSRGLLVGGSWGNSSNGGRWAS